MSAPCTAPRYGDHDWSRPPHNTAETPRDSEGDDEPCQAGYDGCEDERRYEVVVYQPGTHEWIRMFACVPCTVSLRAVNQVARVRTAATERVG